LFQDYIRVYDLKKNIPKMTWTEIAKKIFPHQVCISESSHRHFLKEAVAPSARDTVRKYWKQANMMINKERWREI
jgi:predicted transcriptional regulator